MYYGMDFSLIEKWKKDIKQKQERKGLNFNIASDTCVIVFQQLWGSTNTAFGGIGGSAMTAAYTVIIFYKDVGREFADVYINSKYAYTVPSTEKSDNLIRKDMANHSVASQDQAYTRYNARREEEGGVDG